MIQSNILEQIKTLWNIFTSNKNFVMIGITSLVFLIIILLTSYFGGKKITKIITFTIYLIVIGTLIYFFHTEVFMLVDYLINNIFILLFFPNLAIYTLILIIVNIIMIRSIVLKYGKVLKFINAIFFVIFNIIFYLIIDNVIKNKVNIYEQLSIYTNNNLLILIQISMYLFIIWLVVLLINYIASKLVKDKVVKEEVIPKEEVVPTISKVKEVTPNTIVVTEKEVEEIKNLRNEKEKNIYNEYIDIMPVKKNKNISFSNMNSMSNDKTNDDMDIVFGSKKGLSSIMSDIEKLKINKTDTTQIKKIYENISLNSKELTLDDYNYLIKVLKEIKNNN